MDSPRPQATGAPTQPEDAVPDDMPPLEGSSSGVGTPGISEDGPAAGVVQGRGDVFLILDLPANSTVGCDARALGTATSGFQGIRDFPPGAHFIWISVPNAMSRCGYWFVTTPSAGAGEVRVKQWDRFNEVLVEPATNFETRDHRANIAALYPQLVPYAFAGADAATSAAQPTATAQVSGEDEAEHWQRLTSCISPQLLERVVGGETSPSAAAAAAAAAAATHEWLVDTSDSAAGDAGFPQTRTSLHQTLVGGAGELHFLFPEGDVDLHAVAAAAAGANAVPDTSDDIVRLVDTPETGVADADLVGEMQLAFLTGLHLGNLACVEHWWHLVLRIVLRAHRLVLSRPGLARALVGLLRAQLVYDEQYVAPSGPASGFEDDGPPREYGGPGGGGGGGGSTSILDMVPGNRRRLREALTLYKRRMDETLLPGTDDGRPGGRREITDEQAGVGRTFAELEAWCWRFGWDLRTDYVGERRAKRHLRGGKGGFEDEGDGMDHAEDDEYRPVIVDLDERGREVGLVSFD